MARSTPKLSWFRALGRYYRDPSASIFGKLVIVLALIYVVMPVDLIPDVIPIVGWLDDLGLMGLATWWLARVVARYQSASGPVSLPENAAPERRPFSVSP
jgi:uncharacterized membrane protein YkvA (DUF1232 family)